MTKLEEFDIGCGIISEFCKNNGIKVPEIIISDEIEHIGYYRFDRPDAIYVNVKRCNRTSKNDHPMMIYETNVIGTMLHEFGHYVHFRLFPWLTKKFSAIKNEPFIKFWERSVDEDIAESIRLFVLNPSLMEKGRTKRFAILSKLMCHGVVLNALPVYHLYDKKNEKIDIDKWELFLV